MRKPAEVSNMWFPSANNISLNQLELKLQENKDILPKDKHIYVFCRTGYRSCTGLSILAKYGYERLVNITGGMNEMDKQGVDTIEKKKL